MIGPTYVLYEPKPRSSQFSSTLIYSNYEPNPHFSVVPNIPLGGLGCDQPSGGEGQQLIILANISKRIYEKVVQLRRERGPPHKGGLLRFAFSTAPTMKKLSRYQIRQRWCLWLAWFIASSLSSVSRWLSI